MEFTMVPEAWLGRLRGTSNATFRLAIVLLRLNYKHNGHAFKFANSALEEAGVSANSKLRGLKELEGLGLIAVDRRGFKSPVIKVLHARLPAGSLKKRT
jgi:hypothetical protein